MTIQEASPDASTVLLETEVCRRVRLSKATIRRLEIRGAFPRRRVLAPWRRGWLASEVDMWIQSRRAAPLHG